MSQVLIQAPASPCASLWPWANVQLSLCLVTLLSNGDVACTSRIVNRIQWDDVCYYSQLKSETIESQSHEATCPRWKAEELVECCCCAQSLSRVRLFAIPQTIACLSPLSMGFFKQEHWGGLPFPSPRDLPNPGIELVSPVSPALQVDSLPAETLYGNSSKN